MKKYFPGELTVLGDFRLTGPVMRVSDPCYDRDVWCSGTLKKCKVGTWEAAVLKTDMGDCGNRISVLAVRNKATGPDFAVIQSEEPYWGGTRFWTEESFEVGVDSGQAGFFDESHYLDDKVFEDQGAPKHDFGDIWYSHVSNITLGQMCAGVLPFGAVSTSGFGDGGYTCITHRTRRRDEVDFAFIIFIAEDEEKEVE